MPSEPPESNPWAEPPEKVSALASCKSRARSQGSQLNRHPLSTRVHPDERSTMNEKNMIEDRTTWATGGGVLLGVGVGFFFFPQSIFAFVGSIIGGIGVGLIVTAILSTIERSR